MKFIETRLMGAYVIEPQLLEDERGYFARVYCENEFLAQGLQPQVRQCNISRNREKGTLRGFHYQCQPHAESKLIRCVRGAIYDVIIDLRRNSPTYAGWFAIELSEENRKQLYVPEDFAHGFLTLADETEVFYQMSAFYEPQASRGIRFNDPAFNVVWPYPIHMISDKDAGWSDYVE